MYLEWGGIGLSKRTRKDNLYGFLFMAPFLCFAAVFMIYPMVKGVYNSFYDFRFGGMEFVGLENYKGVLSGDLYLLSIKNSLMFVFIVVPMLIVFGMLISGSIFDKSPGYVSFVRVCLYLPVVASMVVMTIIWRFMLDPQSGLLRYFYDKVGMEPVNLLGDARWTFVILVLILFTMNVGQCVVLYVANLIGIPKDLIEALELDGGNRLHLFRYLLIPLSKPTSLFLFITQSAAVLRVFVVIQLLTNGGPNYSSTTMMYLLYQQGFLYGNFGTASALGVFMFLFTLVLVILQFRAIKTDK